MKSSLIKNIECDIIDSLKLNYDLKLTNASFSKGFIPKYILLDRTRNIHSYFELGLLKNNKVLNRLITDDDFDSVLLELSKIQYSTLDRPLFLLFKDETGSLSIVDIADVRKLFFEQNFSFKSLCNQMYPIIDVVIKIKNELK